MPLAYGSQTGFKNVHKVRPGCFQARVSVKNKGRCTVWTSETAEETAWVLARWRLDPCGLSSPGKKRAHAAQMGCARIGLSSALLLLTCPLSLIAGMTSRKVA